MCLYLAVADHLVDVVAYCVCRVLELSMFTFMMMCTTAKAKLLATTNYYSHRNRNNNALMLVEQWPRFAIEMLIWEAIIGVLGTGQGHGHQGMGLGLSRGIAECSTVWTNFKFGYTKLIISDIFYDKDKCKCSTDSRIWKTDKKKENIDSIWNMDFHKVKRTSTHMNI